jgi:hypothetical protein
MKKRRSISEVFAILSAFILAATATARAECVEDGIARYRKGGVNAASYIGHTGDVCKTLVDGGKDPVVGIISSHPNMAGKVETINEGWTYTFGPKKEAYPETVRMDVIHKSGAHTTFEIKATCIDR